MPTPAPREASASVDGETLAYTIAGDGPLILLVHGWPATRTSWTALLPGLAEFATVVAVDLPGLGDSDPSAAGYTQDVVGDKLSALAAGLGFDRGVTVVGHDVGGVPAYGFASRHRDQVARFVAVESFLAGTHADDLVRSAGGALWHIPFQSAPDPLPAALVAGREADYLPHFFHGWTVVPDAVTEDDVAAYIASYSRPGRIAAGFAYFQALAKNAQLTAAEPTLTTPSLVLLGATSMGNPAFGALATNPDVLSFTTKISNPVVEVVDGVGHWIPEEKPAFLVDRLKAFVAS